jgi:trigger factor
MSQNSIEQLVAQVTLGQYKGLVCPKAVITVYDDEVNSAIEMERQSRVFQVKVDRPAKEGDVTVIDYEGRVDGVAFEGGTSKEYPLTLGSHTFIEGFEEQLVGSSAGDEVDVKVTFPKQYHAENLAGQPAVFHVTVREVCKRQTPELNDEYVKKYCGVDTVDEYKKAVKERLTADKEKSANYSRQQGLIQQVIENSPFELSDEMINFRVGQLLEQYAQRLSMQGLTMEQYYQFTGLSEAVLKEQLIPQAAREIQNTVVLQAIVNVENIEVSDADLDKQYEEMAKTYNMDKAQILSMVNDEIRESICADLKIQKAIDLIDEYSVEE